jgi:hypothetical protein
MQWPSGHVAPPFVAAMVTIAGSQLKHLATIIDGHSNLCPNRNSVQRTIVVDVQKLRPETQYVQRWSTEAGLKRTIAEESARRGCVQSIGFVPEIGDEQIQPSIMVDITRGHSHTSFGITLPIERNSRRKPPIRRRRFRDATAMFTDTPRR